MTVPQRQRGLEHGAAGFTLVEALVAFFIVALTITLGVRMLADGAGWARRGPLQAARVEEAASVMNAMIADPRLAPGEASGVLADGAPWRVVVSDVSAIVSARTKPRLLRIAFFMDRSDGRPLFVTIANGSGP